MRIGLARHFPVRLSWPTGWPTAQELHDWRACYDAAPITPLPVADETEHWQGCLASDLPRALLTAAALFRGEITPLPELREAETVPMPTGPLRLPVRAWRLLYQMAWAFGFRSQKALRDDFHARIRTVADLIESRQANTLVVSHAGTMIYLRRELVRRGYQGPGFGIPEHGRVYVLERA
jgi:broad specificity phosphatase PhoE